MWQLNLISFFTIILLGACFQVNYQTFFPNKLIANNKSNFLIQLSLDNHLQETKKKILPKQNFVNLNKFLELDISQCFINYSGFELLFQDNFQDAIEYKNFEFFYGINPWDKKFFQRLKTNFDLLRAEVEFLIGVEESYSMVNYLSGVNFIIDLQIIF